MGFDYRVVVSSENSPYMAWQTQLFCFSSITRLAKRPTVIVHRSAASLLPEFEIVRSWGCSIVEASQFCNHPKGEFAPRNELGSLLTLAWLPEFQQGQVLFCEPDMLFVSAPQYPSDLCAEHYTYLDYTEERIVSAARKLGFKDAVESLNASSPIGVPYLLPATELPRLALRWVDVLDSFDHLQWIDIMYAFGLAMAMEGLTATVTHTMADNKEPLEKLDRSIIHYCYGDWRWDKRAFRDGRSPLLSEPMPSRKGLSGTILGEILEQIEEARLFTKFPKLFSYIWRLTGGKLPPPRDRGR
jgi:hypothetical protein